MGRQLPAAISTGRHRAEPGSRHRVRSVHWHAHLKELTLSGNPAPLVVPRSACVTEGDRIEVRSDSAWVICSNGKSQILPAYVAREHLRIGGLNLELIIKEITEADEFAAYEALTEFHYRGRSLFGRTSRLIVRCFHPVYPSVVGYVELTTPLYMNKPRAAILDAPFRMNGVSWSRWDMQTTRRHINLIVRIARCVVYPEFRGLGLGQTLVKHAVDFARQRWQVGQLKPYFIEISADMLKFVPFAEKAGMTFIGETEGNLGRIAKDMSYLLKNRRRVKSGEIVKQEACGIVDQQVARMDRAAELLKREGWSRKDLAQRLTRLSEDQVLRDFNLFHEIVSLPKPTYLKGLVPEAERFLETRAALVAPKNTNGRSAIALTPINVPLKADGVSLVFQSRVRRTRRTHAIQQAFGISPDNFSHTVVRNLCFTVNPGEVVLITGSSGSGKSSLLQLLARAGHPGLSGQLNLPANYRPGLFEPIQSNRALIEVLGGANVGATLRLMGLVGLSDAFVYLKRFGELSNGQQYRAMLAKLITSGSNFWLADEFCANLDVVTTVVVADRLQRLARSLGAALVVASSQPETFAAALRPDKVLQLTTAWEHRVMPGTDFLRGIPSQRVSFPAPALRVCPEALEAIRANSVHSLAMPGRLSVPIGLVWVVARGESELIRVLEVKQTTPQALQRDGVPESATWAASDALQKVQPPRLDGPMTLIMFERLRPTRPSAGKNGHVLGKHQ